MRILYKKGGGTLDISYENRVDTLHIWMRHSLQWIPHFHDSIEMVCMLSGSADIMIGGENYTLTAGDFAIAMPNVLHGYYREEGVDAYLLIVPRRYCDAYASLLETHTVQTPVVRAAQHGGKLVERIHELVRAYKSTAPFRRESRKAPEETERRLIAYCLEHYAEEISLDLLADRLHVSRSYISYIFSNKLHVSLPGFIGSLRIAEAKRQIESGAGITEAAYGAGFSSIRTFNRRFAKENGMTPREFRRKIADAEKAAESPKPA